MKLRIDYDKTTNVIINGVPMKKWTGYLSEKLEHKVMGIDPGVNFGITKILGDMVWAFSGKLPAQETNIMKGVEAFNLSKYMTVHFGQDYSAIEGASYNSPFKQVELAEVRFGFFHGMCIEGSDIPDVIAPKRARSVVLGSGVLRASEVWAMMNANAADSMVIALAALGVSLDLDDK